MIAPAPIKGAVVSLFENVRAGADPQVSPRGIDCHAFNMLSIEVSFRSMGTIRLEILGSLTDGAFSSRLADPSANAVIENTASGVAVHSGGLTTAADSVATGNLDCHVGLPFAAARLTNLASNPIVSVRAVPYIGGGRGHVGQGRPGLVPWLVAPQAIASGGATLYKAANLNSALAWPIDERTADTANRALTLYGLQVLNLSGAAAYLQILDQAGLSPAFGTVAPQWQVLVAAGAYLPVPLPEVGLEFTAGLALASTTLPAPSTAGSAAGVTAYAQLKAA